MCHVSSNNKVVKIKMTFHFFIDCHLNISPCASIFPLILMHKPTLMQ